ncbi:MAG TPA: hypothetical protein VME68_14760 [Acidobacteriaceae bacterium]|nr:hypothetical protein [Acidobacteriaceae bacterium]
MPPAAASRRFLRILTLAPVVAIACLSAAHAQTSATSMPLDEGFGPLDPTQPSIPVAQIIQEFTAKETLFLHALDDYTWTRAVKVQTMDDDGHPNGQYYQVVDIYYTPDGKRSERVTDAPQGKLFDTTCSRDINSPTDNSNSSADNMPASGNASTCTGEIMMSERDFSDIEERLPFVLTTEDAAQYNITYLGQQKVDQIDTWVFDVKPKAIQKNKRYFQGKIWVDQKEHQIVVTNGKNVPDDLRPGHEDLTLPFITYRQMVDGKYWFPVYTVGAATLHFQGGHGYLSENANMRETVKYTNYHQFRTSIRVLYNGQDITNNGQPAQPNGQQPSGQQQPAQTPAKPQ